MHSSNISGLPAKLDNVIFAFFMFSLSRSISIFSVPGKEAPNKLLGRLPPPRFIKKARIELITIKRTIEGKKKV